MQRISTFMSANIVLEYFASTHPSEVFSVKLSGIGEDDSSCRHVETKSKRLRGKQGLGGKPESIYKLVDRA